MFRRRQFMFVQSLTLLACGLSALAQLQQPLDPRVDRRLDPRVDGRALDANNRVGSGGYNVDSARAAPNSANLLITGNVTAGRAFRGFSPIRDPSQLFLSVPSGSLGVFQRDSIGVGDIVAGRSQAFATPFFDPSSTTTLSGGVGLPTPQTSLPSFYRAYAAPRTDLLSGRPLGLDPGLNPALPSPWPRAGRLGSPDLHGQPDPALAGSPLFGAPGPGGADSAYAGYLSTAAAPSVPAITAGLPSYSTPEALAGLTGRPRNLLESALGRGDTMRADLAAPPRPETPQERDLLAAGTIPGTGATQTGGPLPVGTEVAAQASGDAGNLFSPTPTAAGEGGLPAFAPAQRSVYQDFQEAVRWIQDYNEYRSSLDEEMTQLPSVTAEYEKSMSFARAVVEEGPKSFAGRDDSPVNQRIRRAEELMKRGEFYSSASQYEVAGTLDRRNPLIALGQGHALLAAGDYLSAVLYLTRGLERFEGVARFKINLYDFVPDPNTLDIRRADLETKLERREDHRLRFLLGYVEYYSGLEKFGLPNLKRAAEQAPEGSVIARLPAMLEAPPAP